MENKNKQLILELLIYLVLGVSISLIFNTSLILVGLWLNFARALYSYFKVDEERKDAVMIVVRGSLSLAVFMTLVDYGMKLAGLNGFLLFK